MADEPADVDPDEFAPDTALTALDDAVPVELMPEPNTDPHALLRSAEFAAGVEVGRAQGERTGFERGLAAGRDEGDQAGIDKAMAAMRMWFFAHDVPHAQHISDEIEAQIKPSVPASAAAPSAPRSER